MSNAFDFDIEKSWECVGDVLSNATGENVTVSSRFKRRWKEAKEHFLRVLGENGRVETKVTVSADVDDARWELSRVLNRIGGTKAEEALVEFIDSGGAVWLLNNRIDVDIADPRPEKAGKKLPIGTKATKYLDMLAIKHGVSESLKQALSLEISKVLARLKDEEYTVVLSVNPLDILMASECTSGGWRSCHALDGEYCAGTLSYMLDDVTAIAYAYISTDTRYYGDEEYVLPRKVWRQMVYFDLPGKSALLSRQYPSENERLEKEARRLAARVLCTLHGAPLTWRFRTLSDYNPSDTDTMSSDAYELKKKSSWHYQDAPTSWVRLPGGTPPRVSVGARTMLCPSCGCVREDDDHDYLLCDECLGFTRCYECDDRIYLCDVEEVDGRHYCRNCLEDAFARCCHCGDVFRRNDVSIVNGDEYCPSCYNKLFVSCCRCCDDVFEEDAVYDHKGNAYCEYCSREYLDYCERCGIYYEGGEECPNCPAEEGEEECA